jgi:hypothetical protein
MHHLKTIILLILFLPVSIFAQITFERTYGGSSHEIGLSVLQTSDNGYIISGRTESFGSLSDVYLIRTDSLGDTLWTKTYGGFHIETGWSVLQTSDEGFIIAGTTHSFGAGESDVYLIKVNTSGDTLWTRTYGGSGFENGISAKQTSDNGFIIVGWTDSFGAGVEDIYLIKTDSLGDTLWTKTYGGTSYDYGWDVHKTTDGGFIITGDTESFGAGSNDVYLIKTDSLGDTLWTRTYGGSSGDGGSSVQQTSDGGYIIAGGTSSFGAGNADVWLLKTNSTGDTFWTRTYGGTGSDDGREVRQTLDGGYIIAGGTGSFGVGGDVYLIKTDSLGDTLWTRTYGGSGYEMCWSAQQTSDGGYVLLGTTDSFGSGLVDVYLIKTDENGLVVGLEESNDEYRTRNIDFRLLQNYPNPFNNLTAISYQLKAPGHTTLKIYNISGMLVETLVNEPQKPGIYQVEWDGARIGSVDRSGIYFYRLQAGEPAQSEVEVFTDTKKLILLK